MQLKKSNRQGFTLAELMIALLINAIFFIALMNVFLSNVSNYTQTLQLNKLNQQMNAALFYMTTDIRRAGYWSNAKNDLGANANTNPFMAAGTDISVGASNTCILFTYDKNSNASLPALNVNADDERYGYRLSNGILQTRPWGASFSCAAAASNWENVTDPKVLTITDLTFTLTTQSVSAGSGATAVIERSVDISISGQSPRNAAITKTLTQHVRVENDNYVP